MFKEILNFKWKLLFSGCSLATALIQCKIHSSEKGKSQGKV